MKNLLLVSVLIGLSFNGWSQVPEFDKLEMYYAQNHYKMVYRKSNRLLDNPEYDFSLIPKFYKSLSLFQLCQNDYWASRHPKAMETAASLFIEIKRSSDGRNIFDAHMYEISFLKHDLISWAEDLKRRGKKEEFEKIQRIMDELFEEVPDIDFQGASPDLVTDSDDGNSDVYLKDRDKMVEYARKMIGTPYVYSGNDQNGFDCSGFTCYVMKNSGKELPRRAVDQYEASRKIKEKNAQKGDLVFFDNGSGISHVGMIVSEKGKPLTMIHASSSKGVIITEIGKSDYWLKRLKGFGTFVY